jgi:hypothetical protein
MLQKRSDISKHYCRVRAEAHPDTKQCWTLSYSQPSFFPSCWDFRASWIVCTCCDTADNILSSSLLNSSKHPQAQTWHWPKKIRPIAWKSNVSSQLNTKTKRPNWWPRAFTDSVFPVPAGPKCGCIDCKTSNHCNIWGYQRKWLYSEMWHHVVW